MTNFQEWLSEQDFDNLPWPFNVLVEAPPETIIAQKGLSLIDALERVVGEVMQGTRGFCPCQGNDKVVALLLPINDICVEVSLYSLDRTYGMVTEARRIVDWIFATLPYDQITVATHTKDFFPLGKKLKFTGPVEIPNYHPSGGSWFYFFMTRDRWQPLSLAQAA